jgi:PAS domain S-box-containing protein
MGRRPLDNALYMLPMGVAVLDLDGALINVNHEFTSITGYVQEDIDGYSFRDFLNGPLTDSTTIAKINSMYGGAEFFW